MEKIIAILLIVAGGGGLLLSILALIFTKKPLEKLQQLFAGMGGKVEKDQKGLSDKEKSLAEKGRSLLKKISGEIVSVGQKANDLEKPIDDAKSSIGKVKDVLDKVEIPDGIKFDKKDIDLDLKDVFVKFPELVYKGMEHELGSVIVPEIKHDFDKLEMKAVEMEKSVATIAEHFFEMPEMLFDDIETKTDEFLVKGFEHIIPETWWPGISDDGWHIHIGELKIGEIHHDFGDIHIPLPPGLDKFMLAKGQTISKPKENHSPRVLVPGQKVKMQGDQVKNESQVRIPEQQVALPKITMSTHETQLAPLQVPAQKLSLPQVKIADQVLHPGGNVPLADKGIKIPLEIPTGLKMAHPLEGIGNDLGKMEDGLEKVNEMLAHVAKSAFHLRDVLNKDGNDFLNELDEKAGTVEGKMGEASEFLAKLGKSKWLILGPQVAFAVFGVLNLALAGLGIHLLGQVS